jgi:hypothetical protein
MVRVGGLTESADAVIDRATAYLQSPDDQAPSSYPAYDAYDTRAAETELVDADLLSPLLLNAAPDLTAYRTLQRWRGALETGLRRVAEVAARGGGGADWPELDTAIGQLFQPLDDERGGHVTGTSLSKVLHRKVPSAIPLYDSKIFWVYCSAPVVRIEPHPERKLTWVEFMSIVSRELRRDMHEPDALELIAQVRKLAEDVCPITDLRAWDIIAWQAAKNALLTSAPPEPTDDDML